jgi:hypothetical protein
MVDDQTLTEEANANDAMTDGPAEQSTNELATTTEHATTATTTADAVASADGAITMEEAPPVKPKKRTAYFIFMDANREAAKARCVEATGKAGVADQAKALGEMWAAATEEDKQVFIQQSAVEKAAYDAWLEKWGHTEAASGPASSDQNLLDHTIPVSKIRKIVKLDPEVKNLSKEALSLITCTTELFVNYLAKEAYSVASIQNRRKLIARDVLDVTSSRDLLAFLSEDMRDLVADEERLAKEEAEQKKRSRVEEEKQKAASSAGESGIMNYFGASAAAGSEVNAETVGAEDGGIKLLDVAPE